MKFYKRKPTNPKDDWDCRACYRMMPNQKNQARIEEFIINQNVLTKTTNYSIVYRKVNSSNKIIIHLKPKKQ